MLGRKNVRKGIAVKLGIEVDEVMRRYNSIRTNYSKYLKYQEKEKYLELVKKIYLK